MLHVPSWDYAPEWANFSVYNRYGVWYWYENKPIIYRGDWLDVGNGKCRRVDEVEPVAWEDSLRERPKASEGCGVE